MVTQWRYGGEPLALQGHRGGISSLAFSADGRRIVTGAGDSLAKLWDTATGAPLLTFRGHTDGIKSVADKYPGLENFMIHWAEGMPPKEFKEQLTWFAKDVMPAFKRA